MPKKKGAPSHRVPNQACPTCGQAFDRDTGVNREDAPKPGDVSVCSGCAQILVYDDAMLVRKMSHEEIERLPTADMNLLTETRVAILAANGRNGR